MTKRFRKNKFSVPDNFVDWMSGYCEEFDDLPDGAWQCCCENAVEDFNKEHGTHIDPFDGWMHWVTMTCTEVTK